MAGSPNASPSRKGTVLWLVLVLALIGAVWYLFLGPGSEGPWPWEALGERLLGTRRR
jgi:hypothetical protein